MLNTASFSAFHHHFNPVAHAPLFAAPQQQPSPASLSSSSTGGGGPAGRGPPSESSPSSWASQNSGSPPAAPYSVIMATTSANPALLGANPLLSGIPAATETPLNLSREKPSRSHAVQNGTASDSISHENGLVCGECGQLFFDSNLHRQHIEEAHGRENVSEFFKKKGPKKV